MAIGRISGPLLKSNLIRDGVDLAFETDLLYLNVTDARIGVNTPTPTHDLHVNGTTRTTNLILLNQLDVGTLHISGNTISSDLDTISFIPSGTNPTIYHSKLEIDDFRITGNTISTTVSNSDIELRPNGTGIVDIQSSTGITGDLNVSGNINAVGNVTIGGDIVIGDALTDNVVINASIQSDLVPQTDRTYDLGSPTYRWRNIYADSLFSDALSLPTLDVGNLMFRDNEITTTTGQDLVLSGNGAGTVNLGNFEISGNAITNIATNAITQILQSGTGYFKIVGTNGFVPPRGDDGNRPTAYAVIGMTRYNTVSKALELWDGVGWASPAGSSGAVSAIQANQIAVEMALTLG